MRNNFYDSMGSSISNLKLTTAHAGIKFKKSQESKKLDITSLEEAVAADSASDSLSKLIWEQFSALRNDYKSNVINTARYMATLRPLKEFLDENPKINNACLNRDEILKEANTYL